MLFEVLRKLILILYVISEVVEEQQPPKKKPAPMMVDLTLSDSEDESPPKKMAVSRIIMPGMLRAPSSKVTDLQNAVVMNVCSTLFNYTCSTNVPSFQLKRAPLGELNFRLLPSQLHSVKVNQNAEKSPSNILAGRVTKKRHSKKMP
jgi:hypothetical protein